MGSHSTLFHLRTASRVQVGNGCASSTDMLMPHCMRAVSVRSCTARFKTWLLSLHLASGGWRGLEYLGDERCRDQGLGKTSSSLMYGGNLKMHLCMSRENKPRKSSLNPCNIDRENAITRWNYKSRTSIMDLDQDN